MALFDLLGVRRRDGARRDEDLELYPGMKVEVTTDDGRMFLAAELLEVRGDRARLKPRMEGSLLSRRDPPVPVTIRGRSSKKNRAVVMTAILRGGPNHVWQAERLELVKHVDNRAFFRMDVDLEAQALEPDRPRGRGEPCRVLNISTGGACVCMATRHNVGDKFLLRVNLLPEQKFSALTCQIVRINQRLYDYFEYGCRFPELEGADENRILRAIFRRGRADSG